VNTDGDLNTNGEPLVDARDPCPYLTGSSCSETAELFRMPLTPGTTALTNLLGQRLFHAVAVSGTGYSDRSRALGFLWRKASDERARGDATVPSLVLYATSSGEKSGGTYDTLPLALDGDEPSIDAALPLLLPNLCGSYQEESCACTTGCAGTVWGYTTEAVVSSDLIDLRNDAYQALASDLHLNLSEIGFPYGARYVNGGEAESVCTFQQLLAGRSYPEAIEACGDFLPGWTVGGPPSDPCIGCLQPGVCYDVNESWQMNPCCDEESGEGCVSCTCLADDVPPECTSSSGAWYLEP